MGRQTNARALHRLSATEIRAQQLAPGYYADGGGLYFRVSKGQTRGWIFRFAIDGRTRDMGLGAHPALSLAEARREAEKCRTLVAKRIDPIDDRQRRQAEKKAKTRKVATFDECARLFVAAHEAAWTNAKHRAQWGATVRDYVSPVFGNRPVNEVNTDLVMKALEPIWATKPETASRVRGRIETVLDWAKVRGLRHGENPARWRGHLDHLLPKKSKIRKIQHHAALPYSEIGTFMAELKGQPGLGAKALEFVILTAARMGEATGARWAEIDFEEAVWTVPAERMKASKPHRVPLSPQAMQVLATMREVKHSEFVFPGMKTGNHLSGMAMTMLLRRLNDQVTIHGFRSTFRDWAAERTAFSREVAEMALAHAIPNAVEAAYRRGDLFEKRRKLMEAWGDFCSRPRQQGTVVALARA